MLRNDIKVVSDREVEPKQRFEFGKTKGPSATSGRSGPPPLGMTQRLGTKLKLKVKPKLKLAYCFNSRIMVAINSARKLSL